MIDYLKFNEWLHTPGIPSGMELRVVDGRIQTRFLWKRMKRMEDLDYDFDWEDYEGDSAQWLKDFDALDVNRWRKSYDIGALDGHEWHLTYHVGNRTYDKSGANAFPDNWENFHKLMEQLGFDNT